MAHVGTGLAADGAYGVRPYDNDNESAVLERAFQQLIKVGWARPDSTFRRVFTNLMIPGALEEQAKWLDDLQIRTTSAANALRAREAARADPGVSALLPGVSVPTLVMHGVGTNPTCKDNLGCQPICAPPYARNVPASIRPARHARFTFRMSAASSIVGLPGDVAWFMPVPLL